VKAIKLPQSRVKRELTSIFRKIESGSLDMVEVTRNGQGIACIVRYGGNYQPPRESLSSDSENYDSWFHKKVMEALADTRSTVPHKQVMDEAQNEILKAAKKLVDEARSLGIFTNHRELASCNECDLHEDVDCNGLLFVAKGEESNKPVDLIFMEMDAQHVRCPLCGRIINCG
jgi:hypothetical protein